MEHETTAEELNESLPSAWQVVALGVVATGDKLLCQAGCKLAVMGAMKAPHSSIQEFFHELEKRFYFRGLDAVNTIRDCVAYLRGEETQVPVERPMPPADISWNGEKGLSEEEYHARVKAYVAAVTAGDLVQPDAT